MPQTELLERDQIGAIVTDTTLTGDGTQASPLDIDFIASNIVSGELRAFLIIDSTGAILDSEGILAWNSTTSVATLTFNVPSNITGLNYLTTPQGCGVLQQGEDIVERNFSPRLYLSSNSVKMDEVSPTPTPAKNFNWFLIY